MELVNRISWLGGNFFRFLEVRVFRKDERVRIFLLVEDWFLDFLLLVVVRGFCRNGLNS